ncbi:MAG: general secretion pathway protein GspN [Proteobacteria bacterium]|nr:general secretion pathway protein GspN [Pseudomonadota bacterium]
MNAADRRRLTPALGIACLLLALALLALWAGAGRGVHWNDTATPARLPPLKAAPAAPGVPPLQDFANVWEHPLFSPDRKPIAGAPDSGDGTSSNNLDLTGVILLPDLRMALLRDRATGRTLRIREGQSAEGASVIEVKPRSAVVEAGGTRLELALKPGPAPTANPGDNPPPGPGADTVEEDATSPPQPPVPATPMADQARARMLKQRIEQRRRQAEARARLMQQQPQQPQQPKQPVPQQDSQQPE